MIKRGDDRDEDWQKTFRMVMVMIRGNSARKWLREPLHPMGRTIQTSNSLRKGSS